MNTLESARAICERCYDLGYVENMSGNLSFTFDSNKAYITQTGCVLNDPMFVLIDSSNASSDVNFHKEIYRLAPTVKWVLHVHNENVFCKFACINFHIINHGYWLGFDDTFEINNALEVSKNLGGIDMMVKNECSICDGKCEDDPCSSNFLHIESTDCGDKYCSKCGKKLNGGICWECYYKTPSNKPFEIPSSPNLIPQQYGWVCPKCGSVMAPFVSACQNCTIQTYTVTCCDTKVGQR